MGELVRRAAWGVVAGLVVVAGGACGGVVAADDGAGGPRRCIGNADCADLGYVCSDQGTCEPANGLVSPGCGPCPGCFSDDACTAQLGRPSHCVNPGQQGTCVADHPNGVTCTSFGGSPDDPSAVFVGSIHGASNDDPAGADLADLGDNQMGFAFKELSGALPGFGIPGGSGGAVRPLVNVSCRADSDAAQSAATSDLLENGHVRALLVDSSHVAGVVMNAVESELTEARTPVICTSCLFALRYGRRGDTSAYFNVAPPIDEEVPALAAKMPEIEAIVRADAAFAGGDIRVALATGGEGYPNIAAQLRSALQFNAATWTANATAGNALDVSYPDSKTADWTALGASIAQAAPHVVILVVDRAGARGLVGAIEAAWPGGTQPPQYLGIRSLADVADMTSGNDALRVRVTGTLPNVDPVDAGRMTTYQNAFANFLRYFGVGHAASVSAATAFGYEAAYQVAYGLAASPGPSSGDLVGGLMKLEAGPRFFTGPADVPAAISALSGGSSSIALSGLDTSLSIDFTTGMVPTPTRIFCLAKDGTTGAPVVNTATGQTFDPVTHALVGTFACP